MVLLYKDKAGNKLYKRNLKTKIQIYAKNKQGKLVTMGCVKTMIKRAKRAGKW